MTTRTITLSDEHWQRISETLEDCHDEGPKGEGWQSAELSAAAAALDAALAQPVAELPPRPPLSTVADRLDLVRYGVTWNGLADEPLLTPTSDGYWTPWHIAARLPQPIPLTERPWERPGWCDEHGRCWLGRRQIGNDPGPCIAPAWMLSSPDVVSGFYVESLPHWALQVPAHG